MGTNRGYKRCFFGRRGLSGALIGSAGVSFANLIHMWGLFSNTLCR